MTKRFSSTRPDKARLSAGAARRDAARHAPAPTKPALRLRTKRAWPRHPAPAIEPPAAEQPEHDAEDASQVEGQSTAPEVRK